MKSLKLKFIIYIIPLIVFMSLSLLGFFVYRIRIELEQKLIDCGFHLSGNLSHACELGVLSEDATFFEPSLKGVLKEEDVVSTIVYNQKGRIIASINKVEIEEGLPQEVFEEILREKIPLKRVDYTKQGEKIYNFFSPILTSGILVPKPEGEPPRIIGFTKVGLSLKGINVQVREIFFIGLTMAVLMILVAVGGVFFLVRKITKPITVLTEGAKAIGKGNLDYQIRIKTGDELEELGKTFNQMAKDLKKSRTALEESKAGLEIKIGARTKELQELAESLEDKVKERTKELQERVEELERFHKLTVGRELKMVELKKIIKELKQKSKRPSK